jgi:hypothetical protein
MVKTLNEWLATQAGHVIGAGGKHYQIEEILIPEPGFGAIKLKIAGVWDFPIDWQELYQRYGKYHEAAVEAQAAAAKASRKDAVGQLITSLEPAMNAMVAEARQSHTGLAARSLPNNNY